MSKSKHRSRFDIYSRAVKLACVISITSCFVVAHAHGPKGHGGKPHGEDPSALTDLIIGDLPEGLEHANKGAFEGGATGTAADASIHNVIQEDAQREDGTFNVPTNGPPSPLFGAEPFSQQMLRFEEFGTKRLKIKRKSPHLRRHLRGASVAVGG